MIKEKARESLRLWIPGSESLADERERLTIINSYIYASEALEDFLELKISPDQFCDRLYDAGMDLDDYLLTIEDNCRGSF